MSKMPQEAIEVHAYELARDIWGYFKGGSAGSLETMQWFDNHRSLGGPAHIIEMCKSTLTLADAARAQGAEVAVKLSDLTYLLRHAFISGFEKMGGTIPSAIGHWPNYDPEECEGYERVCSALTTPPAQAQRSEVAVKPLEWEQHFGKSPVSTLSYRIQFNSNGSPWGYKEKSSGLYVERDVGFGEYVAGPFEDMKTAKAAAQADYEQRIRSALTAPPAPQPTEREKVLEEAIREAIDLLMCRKLGSHARSPEHNARLKLQAALAGKAPSQTDRAEGGE